MLWFGEIMYITIMSQHDDFPLRTSSIAEQESENSALDFSDQAVSASFDPESTPEMHEGAWLRSAEYARDYFRFEHGEMPQDHELQTYVSSLAARLPQHPDFPLKVEILSNWYEINAVALPDGTVFLSIPLIRFAQSEEALLGVLAHEYTHIYREHAKKSTMQSKAGTARDTLLSRISASRAHEYEADMRGVLTTLDEAGINPVGMKDFLERLHEQESKKRTLTSLTHGSGLDRALNIGTMFAFVDFRSIGTELTPLAYTAEDVKEYSASVVLMNQKVSFDKCKDAVGALSRRDLQIALNGIHQRIDGSFIFGSLDSEEEKKPDRHSSVPVVLEKEPLSLDQLKELFDLLVVRFADEHIDAAGIAEEDKIVLLLFGLEYGCGVPVMDPRQKSYAKWRNKIRFTVKDPEHFQHAHDLVQNNFSALALPYNLGNPQRVLRDLLLRTSDREPFGSYAMGTVDVNAVKEFVQTWSDLLSNMSECGDILQPTQSSALFLKGGELVEKMVAKPFPEVKKQVKDSFALERSETTLQEVWRSAGRKLASIQTLVGYRKPLEQTLSTLVPSTHTLSFQQATLLLEELMKGYREVLPTFDEKKDDDVEEEESKTAVMVEYADLKRMLFKFSIRERTLYPFAMSYLLGNHHEGKKFTVVEKNALIVGITIRTTGTELEFLELELDKWGDKLRELDSEVQKTSIEKMIVDELEWMDGVLYHEKNDDALFTSEANRGDVLAVYRYIIDDDYVQRQTHLQAVAIGDFSEEQRQDYFVNFLISQLARMQSVGDMVTAVRSWDAEGVPASSFLARKPELCGLLALRIKEHLQSDPHMTEVPLEDMLLCSTWIANPFLRAAFQRTVLHTQWTVLDFQKKLDLLFPETTKSTVTDSKLQSDFAESVSLKSEIESVRERIKKKIDDVISEGNTRHGVAVIAELLETPIRYNALSFLTRLLKTSTGDSELMAQIYREVSVDRYRERFRLFNTSNDDSVEGIQDRVQASDTALRTLYTLDTIGRHMLLRLILCEHGGVLTNKEKRSEFLDFLFSEWLKPSSQESDAEAILHTIKEGLCETDEWELLYYALSDLLVGHIANLPSSPGVWHKVPGVITDLEEQNISESKVQQVVEGELWEHVPGAAEKKPWEYPQKYRRYSENQLEIFLNKEILSANGSQEQYTPIRFIKEVGSRMGALGTRFLQLLPLFVSMPERYADEFADIYDGVRGQSKLAAVHLLEREWPDMWETVKSIGDRIGGGSIATVYRMEDNEGNQRVIKVRNPNLLFNLSRVHTFITDIIDSLTKNGKNPSYAVARPLLDDILIWIESDVNFSGFLESDALFHEVHDGFQPKGFRYRIKVPKSYGPASNHFAIEEEIIGKNLTKWEDLVSEGHDMKQVIALIVKDFIKQIMEKMVHSDVHIGNFRVTPDHDVAILDRNFFLQLSNEEQSLLASLVSPFVQKSKKQQLMMAYLMPEADHSDEAKKVAEHFVKTISEQKFGEVRESIIAMRQMGVHMPLTFTLILKNLNSLQLMSQKAGFASLFEAYMYTPS